MPAAMASPPAPADRPRELVVSGHVNVDRFLRVRGFPSDDRTVPVVAHRVELGGTAGTIALTATRFGVATGLIARLGDGFPEEFLARLRAARLDLRGLERIRGEPTPTAYILEDGRGHQRTLMDQGAMREGGAPARARPWLSEYSWLHLTTGPPDFQLALQAEGRRRGLRIAADPAQEVHYRWGTRDLGTLLDGAEILFGNRSEIAAVVRRLGGREASSLLDRVPLIVRTEGPDGVTAFSRTGTVHVPATRAGRVESLVGAGDRFRGGFYAAWFRGEPIEGCLGAGVRAASPRGRPGR